MSAEYIIRKAEYSDIDRIYEIEEECFPHPWTIETLRKEYNVPHADILVAANTDNIIGFSVSWLVLDELHLHKIAAANEFKRKGVGTVLINSLIKKYIGSIQTIILEVREKNNIARQFYQKLGFIEKDIRYNYYPDDNAIMIEKKIFNNFYK